jgi:DNA-binding NarL/FixJ family response regulator
MQEPSTPSRRLTVLVYASSPQARDRVIRALGEHPEPGLTIDVVSYDVGDAAIARLDQGGVDLAILDGEAAPSGGMGLARQIKDEIDSPPPVVLLVARRDDAWLASWSRAEAVVPHPVDPVTLANAVTSLVGTRSQAVSPH